MADPTRPAPAAVSDATGNDGPLATIRWKGAEYPVAHPCPAVVARVELHVARSTKDEVDALAEVYTPAEVAEARRELGARLAAREHRAGGELWAAVMGNARRSTTVILWACLAEGGATLTVEDVRDLMAEVPDEADHAVALVLPDFTSAACTQMKLPAAERERAVAEVRAGLAKGKAKA